MYIQFLFFQCSSRIDEILSVALILTLTGKFKSKGLGLRPPLSKTKPVFCLSACSFLSIAVSNLISKS